LPSFSESDRGCNTAFAQRLLAVGESTGANNMIDWPSKHVVEGNTLQDLARYVYDGLHAGLYPTSYFNERAILAARNDVVGNLNAQLLQQMPGQAVEKLSADSVVDAADASRFPIEVLNQLSEPGLPPHKLMLKDGYPVMLLRNLDPKRGLCNGTRLQVKSTSRHVVFCTYLDRDRAGPRAPADGVVLLSRICCRSSEDGSFVEFDRKQFPIRVCFAMTINKSQGQSLGMVGVYLNPEVFAHGQRYVSFSRTTDEDKLWLADDGAGEDADGRGLVHGRVKNIVYDEVFW
jgi:ATP-dependent DNA helicase PIF1